MKVYFFSLFYTEHHLCFCIWTTKDIVISLLLDKRAYVSKKMHNSKVTFILKVDHKSKVTNNSKVTHNFKVTLNSKDTHSLKVTCSPVIPPTPLDFWNFWDTFS